MALRLLLYSSDSDIGMVLTTLLAESDLQVESCSQMLVSLEKLTAGNFDLIVVDWDDGAEANFLLKTARELKSTRECLAIVLVSDSASAAAAIQVGAQGILHKPIVPEQIKETLATVRELISGRPKGGVPPRPAATAKPEPLAKLQRNDAVKPIKEELMPLSKTPEIRQGQAESGTAFSTSPHAAESPEPRARQARLKRSRRPGKRIAVLVAVVFAGALAYIWAPGSSYVERLGSLSKRLFVHTEAPQQPVEAAEDRGALADVATSGSAGMVPTADPPEDDSSNIRVIPVMRSPESGGSTTTVAQSAGSEAAIQQEDTQSDEPAPSEPAPTSAPPSARTAQPSTRIARPSTKTEQAQLPQSLNLSSPINPVQTAAAPVFPGALTPVAIPEDTARQLLVKAVPPSYPEEGLRAGLQGTVVLQAVIAKDGSVREITLVRGSFVFARAAVEAVKQWQYKPYLLNGQAVEAKTLLTVNFRVPAAVPISAKPAPGSTTAQDPSKP
jgi:TonB family protein